MIQPTDLPGGLGPLTSAQVHRCCEVLAGTGDPNDVPDEDLKALLNWVIESIQRTATVHAVFRGACGVVVDGARVYLPRSEWEHLQGSIDAWADILWMFAQDQGPPA